MKNLGLFRHQNLNFASFDGMIHFIFKHKFTVVRLLNMNFNESPNYHACICKSTCEFHVFIWLDIPRENIHADITCFSSENMYMNTFT